MNPITNAKNLNKLNERELNLGLTGSKTSWHSLYGESAWIFVGGLAYDLTEGDVITVFSQYGEIVNMNLVRDKKTGKPKGYCFICYEDQRSTVLAVDNFNGTKLLSRILRVDHVKDYKMPNEFGDEDELTQQLRNEGCGPNVQLLDREKRGRSPEPDRAEKKIKVKREQFSDSENDKSKRNERSSRNENPKLHPERNVAAVKVKEEPINDDYDKYYRKKESQTKDRKQNSKDKSSREKTAKF